MNIPVPKVCIENDLSITEKLLFYSLSGVFFTLPMGTSTRTAFGILAAFFWIISGRFRDMKKIVRQSWFRPVLLFILLPWIGLVYTPDFNGLGLDYAKKVHYWGYGFALACAVCFVPPRYLARAFLIGLAVNALIGAIQLLGILPAKSEWYSGLSRGYATLTAYLNTGILLASFFFRTEEDKKEKLFMIGLMVLFFFHLVILFSRTGYVTFLILSPLTMRNLFPHTNPLRILLICLVLAGLMSASPIVRKRAELSVRQFTYHMKADPEKAWGRSYTPHQDRFYMWYGAVHIFRDYFIFGVGTGGYQTVLKQRGAPTDPIIAHPHNDLLFMAVSYGIFGIFSFLWLFYEMLKNGWPRRFQPAGSFVVSAVSVIMAGGLFNAQILDAGMVFLLALAAGMQQGLSPFRDAPTQKEAHS